MFSQILLSCTEVDILDEHASLITVIFRRILSSLALAHIVTGILLLLRLLVILIYAT